jgi:hypothetical protein
VGNGVVELAISKATCNEATHHEQREHFRYASNESGDDMTAVAPQAERQWPTTAKELWRHEVETNNDADGNDGNFDMGNLLAVRQPI